MTKEELEKEAEEYKDTYFGFADERISEVQDFEGNYIDISERIMKTFKDGAEFGYNKANEWHYVKDGDLPPLRKEVLWLVDKQLWLGELLERQIDFSEWDLDRVLFNDYEIAWKEIVLPELQESE